MVRNSIPPVDGKDQSHNSIGPLNNKSVVKKASESRKMIFSGSLNARDSHNVIGKKATRENGMIEGKDNGLSIKQICKDDELRSSSQIETVSKQVMSNTYQNESPNTIHHTHNNMKDDHRTHDNMKDDASSRDISIYT